MCVCVCVCVFVCVCVCVCVHMGTPISPYLIHAGKSLLYASGT